MAEDNRKPHVLICDPIAEVGVEQLRQHATVDIKTNLTPDDLLSTIGDYEAVIVRSATQITAEVIERGTRLKVIGRAGAGLDNIDVVAAQAHNIEVVNSPDANTLAVAEHTLGLLLALARRLPLADSTLKKGQWAKKQFMGTGLAGKTLGIIGFGRIGREVAIRAQAFGMKIVVNQRRPTPELNIEGGVQTVDLDELLEKSDFVTLHVPLRGDTRGIIGAAQLAKMKPSAYLINTARGGVVNENALLAALNEGKIAGAALDVFEQEPATNSLLIQHERVIATPHIAASTEDAQVAAAVTTVEKVLAVLSSVQIEPILPLRVVATENIFPHESIDQKRVDKLKGRLEAEGVLANPPIVIEVDGKYMVLDGATRTTALKQLGYPHMIVQISTEEEGLGLHTWYHVIQDIEAAALLNLLNGLPNISLVPTEAERAADDMFAYGAMCYLQMVSGETYLVQPAIGTNRLDALNQLTESYIEMSFVERTLQKEMNILRNKFPKMTALVVFPEYTVSQVLQLTQAGRYLPAGITRFVIPGRILRLNADLSILKSDKSLAEKNKWLHELLEEKMQRKGIRYYAEPVILLDE